MAGKPVSISGNYLSLGLRPAGRLQLQLVCANPIPAASEDEGESTGPDDSKEAMRCSLATPSKIQTQTRRRKMFGYRPIDH